MHISYKYKKHIPEKNDTILFLCVNNDTKQWKRQNVISALREINMKKKKMEILVPKNVNGDM